MMIQNRADSMGSNMLFIVGVGRSGTSLLQSMLNAHSRIQFAPETAFVRRYIATDLFRKLRESHDDKSMANILANDSHIRRLKLDECTIQNLLSECARAEPGAFFQNMIEQYAAKQRHVWTGDKDPRLIEYLPLLKRLWPDARIVHIIRDPRDVLASKKKASWSMKRPPYLHIFANQTQLAMGRRQGRKLFGSHYCEAHYEALIAEPAQSLKEICGFLDLEYEPAMLEFGESGKELVAKDEMDWKKEATGPLLGRNSGKWKNSISPMELCLTERFCREAFDSAGYIRTNHKSMPFTARMHSLLLSILLRILEPVYVQWRIYKQR